MDVSRSLAALGMTGTDGTRRGRSGPEPCGRISATNGSGSDRGGGRLREGPGIRRDVVPVAIFGGHTVLVSSPIFRLPSPGLIEPARAHDIAAALPSSVGSSGHVRIPPMTRKERREAERSERKERRAAPDDAAAAITPRSLAKLCLLGVLSGLWSLFLWAQLVLVRSGGSSFCGFGGHLDCEAVWSGAFASTIHRFTGVPIAGWGLAWSAAAFLLPLAALLRRAEGKTPGPLSTAARLVGLGGILAVALMIAESAIAGALCLGCVVTYVVVGAYGFITLLQWRPAGFPQAPRGFLLAAGAFVGAFLLLLYPGLQTPKLSGEAGRKAVAQAAVQSGGGKGSVGTGNARSDKALADLIASLEPALKQTFADSLAIYRAAQTQRVPPPRALVGSDLAPVKITEFTDILCEHCAGLFKRLCRRCGRARRPAASASMRGSFPSTGGAIRSWARTRGTTSGASRQSRGSAWSRPARNRSLPPRSSPRKRASLAKRCSRSRRPSCPARP